MSKLFFYIISIYVIESADHKYKIYFQISWHLKVYFKEQVENPL